MQEKEIERYLTNQVKKINGLCYKFVSPGNAGVPDRIVVLPTGVVHFVELKAPGQKLRKLQELQHQRLKAVSANVCVVDSKAAVDEFIHAVKEG